MKVYFSAGEVSGDIHAFYLIRELRKKEPKIEVRGIGGEEMRKAGMEVLFDFRSRATVGFFKYLPDLRFFWQVLQEMKRRLLTDRPQALVLCDYQGFNLQLAKFARRHDIPTVYYICPQVWIWGKQNARRYAHYAHKFIAVFEREAQVYREAGADVVYVGHPLLDIAIPTMEKQEARRFFSIPEEVPVVGLFPGSRIQELKFLPEILKAVSLIHFRMPQARFILPLSAEIFREQMGRYLYNSPVPVQLIESRYRYDALQICNFAIMKSGTAPLEASLLEVPVVVVYRTSWPSYWLARYYFRIRYASLPNILLDKDVVPELLQKRFRAEEIVKIVLDYLIHPEKKEQMRKYWQEMREKLGSPGAISRAAEAILNFAYQQS